MKLRRQYGNIIIILEALLGCLFCSCLVNATTDAEKRDRENAPIIGHLEMKEKSLTIYRGERGSYYTIRAKDGAVLADKITEAQLRYSFREVHQRLEGGLARTWAIWWKR